MFDVSEIPLSKRTVSRRIKDMANNIKDNFKLKITKNESFSLQLDGTADVSNKAQLLCFICFIDNEKIIEVFSF